MVEDAERGGPLWTPTSYWRGYCARIIDELARSGLADVRRNQTILKGFAVGGVMAPALPMAPWKRAAWRALAGLPGVSRLLAEYRRLLAAEYGHHRGLRIVHAKLAMDEIAREFPGLRPPAGLANGGADDAFAWRNHTLVPAFVLYLSRAADFYSQVPAEQVRAIIEIGPGLGLASLAHMTLNPALRVVANVDIAPVLYISTQFLKSIPGLEVIDYRALRTRDPIAVNGEAQGVQVLQLAPWQLPRLHGNFDYFFNAYSFMEMEPDVCQSYAAQVRRLVTGGVMLHSKTTGHKKGAGGQESPVTLEFLESMFRDTYPNGSQLDGLGARLYGGCPAETRLMVAHP